jgi:hypothetical protein
MSLGLEILSLRQDKFSSVAALIGALERRHSSNYHTAMRDYAVSECADLVLLNVAVHAMDALDLVPTRSGRRASRLRRKNLRHVPGRHQGQILMFTAS